MAADVWLERAGCWRYALPRYAFVYTVVFIVSIDKSVVSLHLCASYCLLREECTPSVVRVVKQQLNLSAETV